MPRPDPIVQATRVRLVNKRFPNEKRRRVAEFIDEHWNDADNLTLTEIATETETSRQHVKNTLETHFEQVEPEPTPDVDIDLAKLLMRAYRMGYRDGRSDAVQDNTEDSMEFEELIGKFR